MQQQKSERHQVARVTDLKIAPSRIRGYMEKELLNGEQDKAASKVKGALVALKKEGCPVEKPVPPKALKKKHTKEDEEVHAREVARFKEVRETYKRYVSPTYATLEAQYKYCKVLSKLREALLKTRTEVNSANIAELQGILRGEVPKRKGGANPETEEAYAKRVAKYKELNFPVRKVTVYDPSNPDQINAEISAVTSGSTDLQLFFEKGKITKGKIRYSGAASIIVSYFAEKMLAEIADVAIVNVALSGKKTMREDNCLRANDRNCSLYSLFCNLPSFVAVKERAARRAAHEAGNKETKRSAQRNALVAAKREGRAVGKGTKVVLKKFEDQEVADGFAEATVITDTKDGRLRVDKDGKPKPKTVYSWKGIDNRRHDSINFELYCHEICREALNDRIAAGDYMADEISVSKRICTFFSNLILDLVDTVTPMAMRLTQEQQVKTVSAATVRMVFEFMLIIGYREKSVGMTLSDGHSSMFKELDGKLDVYKKTFTKMVNK